MSSIVVRSFIPFALLLFILAPSAKAADTSSIDTHVRTADAKVSLLLRQALAASPSFRMLVSRLNESDVIVYVKRDPNLSSLLAGQLTFLGSGGSRRYVVVSLAWGVSEQRGISTLGHELQHAIEVAERPEIVDSASLARAFAGFGEVSHGAHGRVEFETAAAAEAGRRIWAEVNGRAPVPPEALYGAGQP